MTIRPLPVQPLPPPPVNYNLHLLTTDSRTPRSSDITNNSNEDSDCPDHHHDKDTRYELERRLVKLIDQEEGPNCPSIQKGIRVIYVGQDVSNMNFLLRQQQNGDCGEDDVYHFPANDVPRGYFRSGFDQIPQDSLILPPQSLADELVNAYFAHINTGCPIIDEEVFMSQYRGKDPSDAPSLLLLQAVLMVGAHVASPRSERDSQKAAFYRRAKTLFDARIERNRDYMIQAALLLTWHSDPLDEDVTANAHFWVGVAARIATGIGMHRNTASTRFVPSERRMWRRVWWIIFQYDVMVSLLHGRPQSMYAHFTIWMFPKNANDVQATSMTAMFLL